jgi:hypothetical protein
MVGRNYRDEQDRFTIEYRDAERLYFRVLNFNWAMLIGNTVGTIISYHLFSDVTFSIYFMLSLISSLGVMSVSGVVYLYCYCRWRESWLLKMSGMEEVIDNLEKKVERFEIIEPTIQKTHAVNKDRWADIDVVSADE